MSHVYATRLYVKKVGRYNYYSPFSFTKKMLMRSNAKNVQWRYVMEICKICKIAWNVLLEKQNICYIHIIWNIMIYRKYSINIQNSIALPIRKLLLRDWQHIEQSIGQR